MARITVIDDSNVDRMLIAGLLRSHLSGCEIGAFEFPREALKALTASPSDLVITDMVMPDMDGFRVVRELRRVVPRVPVILMTAYGNESIAVKALEAGAASYVPKARQAELLVDTVLRVLARTDADRHGDQLANSLREMHCKFELENDPSLISPLVSGLQHFVGGICIADSNERLRAMVALEEAVLHAMYHGNLEITEDELTDSRNDPKSGRLAALVQRRRGMPEISQRKVQVDVSITSERAKFTIRCEGEGVEQPNLDDVASGACFESGYGRNPMLLRGLMDEAFYGAAGNEITLVKHAC